MSRGVADELWLLPDEPAGAGKGKRMKPAVAGLVLAGLFVVSGCEPPSAGTGAGALPQPGTDAFEDAMDEATRTTLRPGQVVEPMFDGAEGFPAMLEAIRGAHTRVSFETYILSPDATGTTFMRALGEAAQRGVAVRLLADAFGSPDLRKQHIESLEALGVQVRIFNPLVGATSPWSNNRDHRKAVIVDGELAFVGGLNIAEAWEGDGLRAGHFRDAAVAFRGPAVLDAEWAFLDSWKEAGTRPSEKAAPVVWVDHRSRAAGSTEDEFEQELEDALGRWGDHVQAGGVPARIVPSEPSEDHHPILDMYVLAVNAARERVWIANHVFVPPSSLADALALAARRGVDVRLLLQGEGDETHSRPAAIRFYGDLLDAGVRIFEWQPSMFHSKTMVVDGAWCTIGSANLDGRALFLNREVNISVPDPVLASELEARFTANLAHTREVSIEEWKKRSGKQRVKEVLLYPVEAQL